MVTWFGDARAEGNRQRAKEERDALMDGLVGVVRALAVTHARPYICDLCGCLKLPRDKRCPGCDAKAGHHFGRYDQQRQKGA